MPENTRAALPGDLVAQPGAMSEPRMRPVWVSTDPDNGLIGYWLDMEIAAPWRPQAKPPAAPERPAPAGWDTLENVR
jgi:hypothetical protein